MNRSIAQVKPSSLLLSVTRAAVRCTFDRLLITEKWFRLQATVPRSRAVDICINHQSAIDIGNHGPIFER